MQERKMENIDSLDMLLDKYYPKQTADFLKIQARLFQKEAKGRRYSSSFKQHCLAIYLASPKTYRNLVNKSKIFCLPSCSALKQFTRCCYVDPGLQDNVIEMLKTKVEALQEINKYYVICIDEMSLKMHLFYNVTRDRIIGFDNTAYSESSDCSSLPARNIAVLIVRGVCQSWKQSLSYLFSHSIVKASDILHIIVQAIQKLKTISLKVIGITTDMGSNFY